MCVTVIIGRCYSAVLLRGIVAVGVLGLPACSPEGTSEVRDSTDPPPSALTLRVLPVPPHMRRTDDLASEFPEYGGEYVDASGITVVRSTSAQPKVELRDRIARDIGSDRLRIEQAEFSYRNLQDQRVLLFSSISPGSGVSWVSISPRSNRLRVGIDGMDRLTEVAAQLRNVGANLEAIAFELSEPVMQFKQAGLNLASRIRPLVSGTSIFSTPASYALTCTLGPQVRLIDVNPYKFGFLVSDHCTIEHQLDGWTWSPPGTRPISSWRQPGPTDADLIGFTRSRPAFSGCSFPVIPGGSLSYQYCASVDAAVMETTSPSQIRPRIAKPTSRKSAADADIWIQNPLTTYFTVVGTTNAVTIGTVVEKVGAQSGWTYAPVADQCRDMIYGLHVYFCQIVVQGSEQTATSGDSGAPVFVRLPGTNNVNLVGMLSGGPLGGSSTWWAFSPIGMVKDA